MPAVYTNTYETKNYILKSKDTPLIGFRLITEHHNYKGLTQKRYIIEADKIYSGTSRLWPKGVPYTLKLDLLSRSLCDWLTARRASPDRVLMRKLTDTCGDTDNPLRYIDLTYGLSLNDAFMAVPKDIHAKWENCNLYDHEFDAVVTQIVFSGLSVKKEIQEELRSRIITTPEFTAAGALRKSWVNYPDGIYLRKAMTPVSPRLKNRTVITMEYYAAQVAEAMGLDYVPYVLKRYRHRSRLEEVICECPLFTSENIGYVTAEDYFKDKGYPVARFDCIDYASQIRMAEIFGWDAYCNMMLFDSIILNTDRHLGNFGYLVNNNTGKYLGPAPLFDNGNSAMARTDLTVADLERTDEFLALESSSNGKFLSFDTAAYLFTQERHIPILQRLMKFEFKQPEDASLGVDDKTLQAMNRVVRQRSKTAIDKYHERRKAELSTNTDLGI